MCSENAIGAAFHACVAKRAFDERQRVGGGPLISVIPGRERISAFTRVLDALCE
jgi:hypothetical protein